MDTTSWLAQVTEPAFAPELAICDPHHHLWDFPTSRYGLDELRRDIDGGHQVASTVFVECGTSYRPNGRSHMQPVGEVEFVNAIAEKSAAANDDDTRVAAGIVGFADLTLGRAVEDVLHAQQEAGAGRFKGIRHATAWHPDPGIKNAHSKPYEHLMQDAAFIEGLALLGSRALTFDAWLYHHQIPQFVTLARRVPGTTLVLDHFGGPLGIGPYTDERDAVFAHWSEAIAPLADCPNVYCKLGGINMKVNGYNWHKQPLPPTSDELVRATERYYHRAIEVFGTARCMFESNFPMDRESCSYTVLWNAFKKIAARYSEAEQRALLKENAERCYRLVAG